MADKARKRETNRKRIFESKRYKIMLWCAMVAIIVGSTATFAWYGAHERSADSAPAEVMKPYYLTLRNPSDTAALELSIGNLFPGDVKQVVFCVSNKNNEKTGLDMGVTSFDYSIELIYTENLALEYKVFELNGRTEAEVDENTITILDTVQDGNGNPVTHTTYWVKKPLSDGTTPPLTGTDVSSTRHTQVGLTNPLPVNAGKYTSYTTGVAGDHLKLKANVDANGNPTFDSQFFLIEIDWADGAADEFEKYEKETDMIYLLVEALQPEPQKKETQ